MNLLTTKELADFYEVTERTVASWRQKGLPVVGSGKNLRYDLREVVKYFESNAIRDAVSGVSNIPMDAEEAKTRKLIAEATLAEIEVAKSRGILITPEDAEREVNRQLNICRALLRSFPSRLAPWILNQTDELAARELLEKHVRTLMNDMATAVDIDEDVPAESEDDE